MAYVEGKCFFGELCSCLEKTPLSQTSAQRIIQQYEDGLHIGLEHQQELGIESVSVHRKCVDKYCHKKSIQIALRQRADRVLSSDVDLMSKPKRARRSEQPTFSLLQHCFFCVILKRILSIQQDGALHTSVGKVNNLEADA